MKKILLFINLSLMIVFTAATNAQTEEELRGGWIADIDGIRHIYYIVMRNDTVSGVYCFACDNPNNLAIIDDGSLSNTSLDFSLYFYPEGAIPYLETVKSQLINGELHVTTTAANGGTVDTIYHRTPEVEKVIFPIADFTNNQPVSGNQRSMPGLAETITPETVVGMWLWGTGPSKQYFFFKKHKDGIRGMVCGPCSSANDMAPLEQISMTGTNFHFEIVHEDNGGGFAENGPHSNVTDAVISKNEMLMSVIPSFSSPDSTPIEMTLLGPVKFGK